MSRNPCSSLFTYEYHQISWNHSNRLYQKHQHSPYRKRLFYSPCQTSSAEHLTHSTIASVKAQLTQRREPNPLTPLAQQSLPSNSHLIKTRSLLSLNHTLMRLSLVQEMVQCRFPVFCVQYLINEVIQIMLPNPNTAFGDGDATRETNPRQTSKVARQKKILTGLLARRNHRLNEVAGLLGSSL